MDAPPKQSGYLRISSDAIPARDRHAVVRELFGRHMMRLEIEPRSDAPFRVDMSVRMLPRLGIVSATSSPLRASRTRALMTDGDDSLVVQISTSAAAGSQFGRDFSIAAGDAVVMSNADSGVVTFPSPATILALRLPRDALEPLLRDRDAILIRTVPKDTVALMLLVQYLRIFEDEAAVATPALQHLVATHVYDLLSLALGATRDAAAAAQGRGVRAARLHAIKADIAAGLGTEGLTIATMARRQGVSESYIRKLFASEDTSFSEFVLNLRLTRAHHLLTDPRFADSSIGSIAFDVGFGDLSYFNRSFRRRFGDTPSGVRARERRQEAQ